MVRGAVTHRIACLVHLVCAPTSGTILLTTGVWMWTCPLPLSPYTQAANHEREESVQSKHLPHLP